VVLPVVPGETCDIHPDLAKSTVLVADPSPTSRQIASTMLSAWGCRTLEVPSIHQAVDAIRSGRIVAVLTAQYLTDGDARDLVQAIRAERAGEHVGIALLAPIFQRHKERLLATTGATALVVKPLRNANLLTTMNQLLTGAPPVTPNVPAVQRKGFAGKRVLVVEDNATNRMLALRILEVLGLRSSAVSCGEEALDTLAVETYDLVLMDCQMPKLDGLEATKLFREREARETALMRRMDAGHLNRRACIVAVTAHAMAGDRERCIGAGMDDYLAKPYTIDDLRKMLEKWIG
jgi:two-component system, sensor histidine kinase and response regulator